MANYRLTETMESRIHRKVYVRFGGEYPETQHRNMKLGVGYLAYIQNTVGNIFSGQVVGETAKNLSERFGKILQQRQSWTSLSQPQRFPTSRKAHLWVAWRITSARRLTRRFSTHASSWIVQRSMPRQRHTRRFLSSMSSKTRTATTLCRSR